MKDLFDLYKDCTLCPRECHVNRISGQIGFCGQTSALIAAKAYPHMWEEPCICGPGGSGTVFFSGCNLKCVYCQNFAISRGNKAGKEISAERLYKIYFELKLKGVSTINLVTPTHFLPHIAASVKKAKEKGINLPFVYNCGGYEKAEYLKLLYGLVDIYLTDVKYYSNSYARRYSKAPGYFSYAIAALKEMAAQCPKPVFYKNGMLKSGVIVRHLVLPGMSADSKRILNALYSQFGNNIVYSIMSQFTPINIPEKYSEINRTVSPEEYNEVVNYAESLGISFCYIQKGQAALSSFIPDFDLEGI